MLRVHTSSIVLVDIIFNLLLLMVNPLNVVLQLAVEEAYQENPFHNFRHAFSVTQMVRLGRTGCWAGREP